MVKSNSLTVELPRILIVSRKVGACGTNGGAVKCIDIIWNSGGEGGTLDLF
jgi:hypothetical protein